MYLCLKATEFHWLQWGYPALNQYWIWSRGPSCIPGLEMYFPTWLQDSLREGSFRRSTVLILDESKKVLRSESAFAYGHSVKW